MWKKVLGVLMAVAVLAAKPIPSRVITVTVSGSIFTHTKGTIVVSELVPSDAQLFDDAQDVLSSITSANKGNKICSLRMNSTNQQEKSYKTGWVCDSDDKQTSQSQQQNLDGDPPLEFQGCVILYVCGFSTKHDSGNVRVWGWFDDKLTAWKELGGPVIGFKFKGDSREQPNTENSNMSLIVGDRCRGKYFGAQKLSVRLGQKRQVQFYWQQSYSEYYSTCLSKGLFFIQNTGKLSWVVVSGNTATIFPGIENVYSSFSYLSMSYQGQTKLLRFSIFRLYSIPTIPKVSTEVLSGFGVDYRGFQDHTTTGRLCQKWTSQLSKDYGITLEDYPTSGLGDHNFCRNPERSLSSIWCFTYDQNQEYEKCEPLIIVGTTAHLPITSRFGDIEEAWLPATSKFRFSGNINDYFSKPYGSLEYGTIMFCEFEQAAQKSQDCTVDCNTHKYLLKARYQTWKNYSVYQIEDDVIVTSMKRFYLSVHLYWSGQTAYQGSLFAGVAFRENSGITVKSKKKEYYDTNLKSTSPSNVFGTETTTTSGWIPVGGPIKGSYVVKDDEDEQYDYISDFGLYVQDPCQAFDNKLKMNLNPNNKTIKDIKFHLGTDSQFWLPNICQDDKALRLVEVSAFPFLKLRHGNLAILSIPQDRCTRLEVQHHAPDNSSITNVFYLHLVSKFEATLEPCQPHDGNCQPKIKDLALTGTAGIRKTVTLFHQTSVESYFRACEGALFDLTGAPDWLSLTNSSFLVIDPPNNVNIPEKYQFFIGIWKVKLEVNAPCNSNYLEGLKEQGQVSVYIDETVELSVAFELDDKQQSWEKVCGSIQRVYIHNAPIFVRYNEHRRKIQIKPQEKVDQGLHIILIELEIKSEKSFNALEILVKLPITYIKSHIKPFFWPQLSDELKQYGEEWRDDLSSLHDPVDKFTYVSKSKIVPKRASEFVKMVQSSDTITNATRIFFIAANSYSEKTGNVTIFAEISAFNQNYSVFEFMRKNSRRQMWRWRRATYGFNLTIVHPEQEIIEIAPDNICNKRFIANYKKELQIGNKTINFCKPNFSQNITMTKTAQVSLKLGDFFTVPSNFDVKTNGLQTIYEFKIGGQQLSWKPVEYITKKQVWKQQSTATSSKTSLGQKITMFTAQLNIKNPWNISKSENLMIKICEPEIVMKLQKNCLQLSHKIPVQIYGLEKTVITAIFRVLLIVNLILMIMNSVLLIKQDWNLPPSYFSNLLLLCHMLATGIKLPGAATEFNQQIIEAIALKFKQFTLKSDYLSQSQLDSHKIGLLDVGYQIISTSSNLGFTLCTLFYLTKFFFISSKIILFFVKRKTRCGKLRLGRHLKRITENISTGSYFNFEMSSSIVQITSAFVYLRFSKTYKSSVKVSATTLWQQDFFVAVMQIWVPVYLCLHLLVTADNKGWWGLRQNLVKRRSWYAQRHRQLMYFPSSNMSDKKIRVALTNLEKVTEREEDRFQELKSTIGDVQSENIYPSIVGLERSVLYILLKLIMPVLFAAILVFVDTIWIAVCSYLLLSLGYFVLQLFFVKANISTKELINCGFFIFVPYISVFLFIQETHIERNYFGWIYIFILTINFGFTGVEQLQKAVKRLKLIINIEQSFKINEFFLQKATKILLKTATEINLSLNAQGLNIIWSTDIFSTLAFGVWKREELCKEMQYWIEERIRNTPQLYEQNRLAREQVLLKAASDIFFCKILVYVNEEVSYTIRPRQEQNLMLKDCGRTLKIWFADSSYGVLLHDQPPLMRCPYPKKEDIPLISRPTESYREQKSHLIEIQLDEEMPHKNHSSTLISNQKLKTRLKNIVAQI